MRMCDVLVAALCAASLVSGVRQADAQTFENVGVRAQGMAGAFVAVADDATASWWNPAGLASGTYLSAVVERGRTTEPATPSAQGPARRVTSSDFAAAFPALALSYYRLRVSEIAIPGSTGAAVENRQDPRTTGTSVRSVSVSQFGSTFGQSVGEHLVLGTTVKLLLAGRVSGSAAGSDPLDDADGLDVSRHLKTDVDAGALARFGHVRVGVSVKNISKPSFGDGEDSLTLKRQARVGVAVLSVPYGALQGFTVAADADLTTSTTAVGRVRHVSTGVEGWLAKGRIGLRAGVLANTVDERRPAVSGGVSVGLTHAFLLNASRTVGRDESVTGWSAGVSVAF
jgi:hypothetical protein